MKPCGLCSHKARKQIDALLVAGATYRTITNAFPNLSRHAVGRHKRDHLPELMAKAAKEREAVEVQDAKDLVGQCTRYLKKANEMLAAADEWLRDPETGRFNLDPRSTEINVIYSELVEGKEVRRKAPLSQLLAKAEGTSGMMIHHSHWRVSDPRDLFLRAIDRGGRVVELLGKLSGELTPELDLQAIIELVVQALRPHPKSLVEVIAGLRQMDVPLSTMGRN